MGGGKEYYQLIWTTIQNLPGSIFIRRRRFWVVSQNIKIPSSPRGISGGKILSINLTLNPILIAICKVYEQVYFSRTSATFFYYRKFPRYFRGNTNLV
ncbi:MAG: hypothetical protein LBR79_06475 [Oscillospiraceae bacterium]|nr:hypothetical protein [Oscillospiraceae bacterium]